MNHHGINSNKSTRKAHCLLNDEVEPPPKRVKHIQESKAVACSTVIGSRPRVGKGYGQHRVASNKNKRSDATNPRFSVGTRFLKGFPGEGTFQGTITAFDGEHYTVYYPSDGDDEDLSDNELDELKIIDTPSSRAVRRTLLATKR